MRPEDPQTYDFNHDQPELYKDFTAPEVIPGLPHGPFNHPAGFSGTTKRPYKGLICGCSLAVFILTFTVALLSAMVLGLAAATGIENNRANAAEASLAQNIQHTVTVTANLPTSTLSDSVDGTYDSVTRNCSSSGNGLAGTGFSTSPFYDEQSFDIWCNYDTLRSPIQALFVRTFDECMLACASYTHYISRDFPNVTTSTNVTCGAVSFVPKWFNMSLAELHMSPGSCYLKPGPFNSSDLFIPQNKPEVHAAFRT
ncbi:hypothetical protein BX600DRAFT_519516 [Xylariales sp. PMI_506]|nr:hypothetical protein BX600DRAFT_519516 [Xylariales sp. PMI_506]